MSAELLALLHTGQATSKFGANSRYLGVETTTLTSTDGETIAYLRRRFLPNPDRMVTTGSHSVSQGERLDLMAAAFLGDPELYWRIVDANPVLNPSDLEGVGVNVRLALPEVQ